MSEESKNLRLFFAERIHHQPWVPHVSILRVGYRNSALRAKPMCAAETLTDRNFSVLNSRPRRSNLVAEWMRRMQ